MSDNLEEKAEKLETKIKELSKAVGDLSRARYSITRAIDKRTETALKSINESVEKAATEICKKQYNEFAGDIRKMVNETQQEELDKITGIGGVNIAVQSYLDLCRKNGREASPGELEAIIKGVIALALKPSEEEKHNPNTIYFR